MKPRRIATWTVEPPIKYFCFDIGNVLLNYDMDLFHQRVADLTRQPLKDVKEVSMVGARPYWHRFEIGKILPYHFYRYYCEALKNLVGLLAWSELRVKFSYAYYRKAFGDTFTLDLNSLNFMRGLKVRGAKIILVSNNNPIHYEYCLRTGPEIFRLADECLLSHEVGLRKPDPAMWLKAVELGNFNPWEAMAVDDKSENIDGALQAGMMGHVFTSVPAFRADLEKLGFEF
ncbi:MAG: HAD-IA family hydrolase [bacterium]|nr:HAD-IA family hydrolase [bacterium]